MSISPAAEGGGDHEVARDQVAHRIHEATHAALDARGPVDEVVEKVRRAGHEANRVQQRQGMDQLRYGTSRSEMTSKAP